MAKPKTFATENDLAASVREKAVALLNQQLADITDLYSQTKQAHWNVKGMHFHQLHLLFDSLAESLEEYVDEIAERATALGGRAMGTVRMAATTSRLPEYPIAAVEGSEHVEALVERYAHVAKSTRAASETADDLGDADTTDLFTQVSRGMDQHLWFLEAHVQA